MTNTNIGLWENSQGSYDYSGLIAQYPQIGNYYNAFVAKLIVDDSNGVSKWANCIHSVFNAAEESVLTPLGGFYTLKYEYYWRNSLYNYKIKYDADTRYFCPDLGLVKLHHQKSSHYQQSYDLELVNFKNSAQTQDIYWYSANINHLGEFSEVHFTGAFINHTFKEQKITTFMKESRNCSIDVQNNEEIIKPGENFDFAVKVTPKEIGNYNGKIIICTDGGNYCLFFNNLILK